MIQDQIKSRFLASNVIIIHGVLLNNPHITGMIKIWIWFEDHKWCIWIKEYELTFCWSILYFLIKYCMLYGNGLVYIVWRWEVTSMKVGNKSLIHQYYTAFMIILWGNIYHDYEFVLAIYQKWDIFTSANFCQTFFALEKKLTNLSHFYCVGAHGCIILLQDRKKPINGR